MIVRNECQELAIKNITKSDIIFNPFAPPPVLNKISFYLYCLIKSTFFPQTTEKKTDVIDIKNVISKMSCAWWTGKPIPQGT